VLAHQLLSGRECLADDLLRRGPAGGGAVGPNSGNLRGAALKLCQLDIRGWSFAALLAGWILIFDVLEAVGGTLLSAVLSSMLVSALVLIYCLLPGTRDHFSEGGAGGRSRLRPRRRRKPEQLRSNQSSLRPAACAARTLPGDTCDSGG
jgi:hypothetical protein